MMVSITTRYRLLIEAPIKKHKHIQIKRFLFQPLKTLIFAERSDYKPFGSPISDENRVHLERANYCHGKN